MMQFVPDRIRSGVVVGSPFASWPGKIIYKDQEISPIEAKMEIVDNLVTPRAQDLGELMDETKQIYFENSPADLLVIEGGDDPIRLSPEFAGQCLSRARASGKTNCRHLLYPGLGHLLDLPYSPLCTATSNPQLPPGVQLFYGGQEVLHQLVQLEAWDETLDFYRTTLGGGGGLKRGDQILSVNGNSLEGKTHLE